MDGKIKRSTNYEHQHFCSITEERVGCLKVFPAFCSTDKFIPFQPFRLGTTYEDIFTQFSRFYVHMNHLRKNLYHYLHIFA